jgi:branched-chain amino acid transport system ATP-binding protein
MTPLLELDRIRAFYGGALILDGVSLRIDAGETVGLVGRNGAGKTTTLLAVYGVPAIRSGHVRIDGSILRGRRKYEPATRGVALVPQGRRVFSNLTVEENLLLGIASGRKGRWTVPSVFDLFPNLMAAAKRRGTALSGGEQQMLAIGRALLGNPKVLLLDEPSEGLAPVVIDQLVDALVRIRDEGTALLLVEQNIRMVQRLAARFVALSKGTVVAEGSVDELATRRVQELIAL